MKKVKNFLLKVQYQIDNAFSRGTPILIFWLGVISLFIMVTASIIIVILKISIDSSGTPVIFEVFWHSVISMISPGEIQENQSWVYRVIMLFVTLGGIFITSTLIGLISSSINQKLESLQRGRSTVFEEGHIVILGSNDQVFTIIHELIDAYQNSAKRKCIVLMGQFDKIEMDNKIHEIFPRIKKVRIVIRTGNPVDPYALDILNLQKAKAIIILSPDVDDPDSEVIKTCLAILKNNKASADRFHIIAEIRNSDNKDVVKVFEENDIDWILSGEIISKITAQTCRQSGLSIIYTDLLDFAGDEIRLFSCKDLVGNSFGNVINLFEINSVIGLVPSGQKPILNPPMNTRFAEGDQLLLLAENQDNIFINTSGITIDEGIIEGYQLEEIEEPEVFLFLGWNWKLPNIIKELDNYVPKHSRVDIFYDENLCNDKYQLSEKLC